MAAEAMQLTSTTAPGRFFSSRKELADHYKSDWHRYNLKRREAGLPLLLEGDFLARLEAAKAMRQESKQEGTSHLKPGKQKNKKKKPKKKDRGFVNSSNHQGATFVSQASGYHNRPPPQRKEETLQADAEEEEEERTIQEEEEEDAAARAQQQQEEEGKIRIDPYQCLFDHHTSASVEANVERMYRKYGFFLPDREYLVDLEGLVGYCHEKIKLGHMCLYCHKVFPTWQACQKHMISKQHTKLLYEPKVDMEEYSVFYDFSEADEEFLTSIGGRGTTKTEDDDNKTTEEDEMEEEEAIREQEEEEDGGGSDWEDVSDDDTVVDKNEDDDYKEEEEEEESLYDGYEEQLENFGFDITPLGELILPDGRIVGHRSLSRYYKQRLPTRKTSVAVVAARRAAGDRLYQGQVYNIHPEIDANSMVLAKAGIKGSAASAAKAGRAAKGILVQKDGVFTATSIYRYKAAVKKQRRDDKKGMRLKHQTGMNINRMDKKHNRLMNGVSVAHAAR